MADGPDRRQSELRIDLKHQVNLIRLISSEGLSQHFTSTVDLISDLGPIDFLEHLGKPAFVTVYDDDQVQRYFHGLVADAEFLGEVDPVDEGGEKSKTRGFSYRMTLKPAAYFHSQGRDFRVYQNKSTLDIIEATLTRCNIKHSTTQVTERGKLPPRSYCVQYGESDFGFVSRLMEEDGLYYYYEHSPTEHTLTICDAPRSHVVGKASPLTFVETSRGAPNPKKEDRKNFLHEWRERVSSGAEQKVTMRDFDFMKSNKVEGVVDGDAQHELDAIEFYNYPARSFQDAVNKHRSDVILESRRANRQVFTAETSNAAIMCGKTFVLKYPERPGEKDELAKRFDGKSFLIIQTTHVIASEVYASSMGADGKQEIQIEAVPVEVRWRAPITSRRPVVLGPETAWVTGPQAEEIYTDKFGRVKIQFHWDRLGKRDENSSCWVRVSQTGGLGNVIMPRVGHEVVVDFMGGDPDRPFVVGRMFNSTHMPVYAMPGNMTKASWISKSHKTKAPTQYAKSWVPMPLTGTNEMHMEDKTGHEHLIFYASKDSTSQTQNNNQTHIGVDQDVKVGQNRTMKIGADDTVKIVGNRETKIDKDETRKVQGKRESKIDGTEKLDVGQSIKINAGTEITIEAGSKITLVVGGSKITMDKMSINISTTNLTTDGKGGAVYKGGQSNTIKMDPGIMTISGTMIKIN